MHLTTSMKFVGAAVFATVAAAPLAGTAAAQEDPGAPTLAEVLLADGDRFDDDPFDYDIVTEAVLLFPDLVAAASDPSAELTVFLPNDRAFRRLVRDLTGMSMPDEQATFGAVAGLGLDTVEAVLTFHIVAGPPISFEAATESDGATLSTLQGGVVTVDVHKRFSNRVSLIDLDPGATDARVIRPEVGGAASNGYAHGIDRVLRPVDL